MSPSEVVGATSVGLPFKWPRSAPSALARPLVLRADAIGQNKSHKKHKKKKKTKIHRNQCDNNIILLFIVYECTIALVDTVEKRETQAKISTRRRDIIT